MALLDAVRSPKDLRALSRRQLDELAAEIRTFLVHQVARTGGHLGPNLGVVELTLAIHRVFDSPRDPILFDTGHQAYVHKIVTGRQAGFASLRQPGGLSGYPSRAESEHDWIENSHASAALSWGEGMAKAFRLQGRDDTVVVVVGDGALTGGMAWEALNNISVQQDLRLVIVVNDNGRSYTPTVGGMMAQTTLTDMRTDPRYEQTLDLLRRSVTATPLVGKPAYDLLHAVKTGLKDVLAPQTMFSDLGLKYIGPIDGHDEGAVETALHRAKDYRGPVIVHCMTTKGKGFAAAEAYEEDAFHSVGKIDAVTGEPLAATVHTTWTDVFGDELVRLAARDERIVALTAAMLHPTGLSRMATTFPQRVFDVGIAEQHAVASAAGLATAGLHPVFAVYATFLNRAFDQVLLDVALHKLGVTFCLDRAGITGTDGASHNGMWDLSLFGLVPGLQLTAPRDAARLREALDHAVTVDDAPTLIRYSKDPVGPDVPAIERRDGLDILFRDTTRPRVLVVSYGPFAQLGIDAGQRLAHQGIGVTVVDPLWALPVNPALVRLAAAHDVVVTMEDNLVVGGLGMQLDLAMRQAGVDVPLRPCGVPQRYLDCGVRADLLNEFGITAQDIARIATEAVSRGQHVADVAAERRPADH